jgi:hypothetical protein
MSEDVTPDAAPKPKPASITRRLTVATLFTRRGVPMLAGGLALSALLLGTGTGPATLAPPPAFSGGSSAPVAAAPPSVLHPSTVQLPRVGDVDVGAGTVAFTPEQFPADVNGAGVTAGPPTFGYQLPFFDSPYIGHTGSRDGAGGQADGSSKASDLDLEKSMGLHWTFMEVYWSKFEPNAPTDYKHDSAGTWKELDGFMVEAHKRGLYPLVMIEDGGNGGGPPSWAGARTSGSAAPANMAALVDFVGKVVERYHPGGTLAQEQHWGNTFGALAWELENEPSNYQTNWSATACDYSEFLTKASRRIKSIDPRAVVVAPALQHPSNSSAQDFLNEILDRNCSVASDQYKKNGVKYAAGPTMDVVSFHGYEQLDSVFDDSLIQDNFPIIKKIFDNPKYVHQPGFSYALKTHYWCTECEYDFAVKDSGATGAKGNWLLQWFARAFAAGVERVTVMDANLSTPEQQAATEMIRLLPRPWGIQDVTKLLGYDPSAVSIYRWTSPTDGHWVYVAWAANGSSGVTVKLPVQRAEPFQSTWDGGDSVLHASAGSVTVTLAGSPGYAAPPADSPQFSEPVFVIDGIPGAV